MTWIDCDQVEVIPGKQGGVPLVKGTRIPAQQIVEESESGSPVDEIAEDYPSLSGAQIETVILFAHTHQLVP